MTEQRFKTTDGETLMNTPLQPLAFVVEGLIAPGLHLLAGAAEVGKSWLALWLALSVAKGETVWGLPSRQGTTLYLCLEDSTIRIQNRLFEITEDTPDCVHFATGAQTIGNGLEQQVETFLAEHPDTVLVIIDTLQMVRRAVFDTSYANDYRELSALNRLADAHGIAILLIHHLRKEGDNDTFNRISGTTALQGAVDSSFTLVESQRGSGRARLCCIGQDIEYRELELSRNSDNVWEMLSDSAGQPELLQDNVIPMVCAFMRDRAAFTGTPTEVARQISAGSAEPITAKALSKRLVQNREELANAAISFESRRSNGKRLITLYRLSDDSDGETGSAAAPPALDPVDPVPSGILQTGVVNYGVENGAG